MALPELFVVIGAKIAEFEKAMADVSQKLNTVDKQAQRTIQGFEKIGQRLGDVGRGLAIGITAPLVAATGASLKFAGDFESSMNRIQALGEITGKDLERLRDQALQLGKDTKFSAQQAADGMAEFAAAGFNAAQIFDVMPGTLALAAAGAISVADAARLTKDILGQFGLAAKDAGDVANLLAKASADSSGTLLELGNSLTYAGPVAKSLGLSLTETVAALVELDKAGIRSEKAGTGLRGVLASIVAPSREAGQFIQALGVHITDAEGKMLPFSNIIEQFRKGLANLGDEGERNNALFQIFGREANTAAQILINQGGPALDNLTKKLNDNGNAAQRMAQIMNKGLNGALEELKGSVETAAIAFGEALIPVAVRAAKALQAFVNETVIPAIQWFKELSPNAQTAALALAAIAAAIGPLLLIAGQLAFAVTSLIPAFALLGKGIALAGGFFTTFATTTLPLALAGLRTFALTTLPAAIAALSQMASVMLTQAIASLTTFATVTVPAAIQAMLTFATVSRTAVIADLTHLATTAIPAAVSGFKTLIVTGISGATTALVTFVSTGVTASIAALKTMALTALPLLTLAATVAAAAFVSFKLGQWAYEQIPGVKTLGDAMGEFLLLIPGVEYAVKRLSGAQGQLASANKDLEYSVGKLEDSLKRKGITVERAGMTTEQYADALRKAAKESGLLGTATSTERAKIEALKKQIKETEENAKLYSTAQAELGITTKRVGVAHEQAKPKIREFNDEILLEKYRQAQTEHRKLVTEIATLERSLESAAARGEGFNTVLDRMADELPQIGHQMDDISKIKLPSVVDTTFEAQGAVVTLQKSLETLGIKGSSDLKKVAEESAKARDAVLGSGLASDFEKKTAIYRALVAQVEYAKVAGIEITAEQKATLERLGKELEIKLPEQRQEWNKFGKDVSTIISNTAQDMAKALFEGDFSFGERFKKMAVSLGEAIVAKFIEPATKAISDFISGVLSDLLSGKGLGGVIDRAREVGDALAGVFRATGPAAPGGTPPATAPGGVGGAAGAGIQGIIGAVTGIVTAAASVVQAFQLHGIGNDTGKIEVNTRETSIALIGANGVIDTLRRWLPVNDSIFAGIVAMDTKLADIVDHMRGGITDRIVQIHDLIATQTNDILLTISNSLQQMNVGGFTPAMAAAGEQHVHVYLDGREIADYLIRRSEEGGVRF